MKKILMLILLIMVIFSFLISCSNKSEENTITVQRPSQRNELVFYEEIAKEFTKQTGIKVEFQALPPSPEERLQTIVTAMRSKQKNPDVLWMDVAWVGQVVGANWLAPMKTDVTPFFEGTIKNVLDENNNPYALPMFVDLGMFFYRTDLLEKYNREVPQTWKQLVDTAMYIQQEERAAGNKQFWGYTWTGAQTETLVVYFLEHALSKGTGIYDKNGNINLNTAENREALQTMVDFSLKYNITAPDNYIRGEGETMEFYQTGNVLFQRNWPFVWAIHNSDNSPIKGNVGVALIPKYEGGKNVSGLGGWFWGVSAYSDNKEGAQKWVEFVTSKGIQERLAKELGFFPGRKDIYQNEEILKQYPIFADFEQSLKYAAARPVVPYYSEMARILKEKFNAAISQTLTIEEALKQAQKELEVIEAQYSQN